MWLTLTSRLCPVWMLVAWQAEWSKGRVSRYLFPTKVGAEGKAGAAPGAAVGDKAPPHAAPAAPRTTTEGAGGPTASSLWAVWAVLVSAARQRSRWALCRGCMGESLAPCDTNSWTSLITNHLLPDGLTNTQTTQRRNATVQDATQHLVLRRFTVLRRHTHGYVLPALLPCLLASSLHAAPVGSRTHRAITNKTVHWWNKL